MWDSDVGTVNANCKYLKNTVIVLLMLLYQTDYLTIVKITKECTDGKAPICHSTAKP